MHMVTNQSSVLTCGWALICYPVGLTVLRILVLWLLPAERLMASRILAVATASIG